MTDTPNLATALAAFQADLPTIRKTASGQVPGRRDYKYADLADVNQEVLPKLAQHGLSYLCGPARADDGTPVLRWELLHVSGESRTGDYELPREVTPQQMGSAITYGRRYTITAVTGVVADEDDDGAAATEARQHQQRRPIGQAPRPPADKFGGTDPDEILPRLRVDCAAMGWDLGVVAGLFESEHGRTLKACNDAKVINDFWRKLAARSDQELKARAPEPVGVK